MTSSTSGLLATTCPMLNSPGFAAVRGTRASLASSERGYTDSMSPPSRWKTAVVPSGMAWFPVSSVPISPSVEAQPVAVERQGAVEVSYREGDDMDARLHGRFLILWQVMLQSMIGARD
jgi:hypothetical protein